jgi:hypothetical protein
VTIASFRLGRDPTTLLASGKRVYGRCLSRDVTRLQEAEKALADADRRNDEFLATLAHESGQACSYDSDTIGDEHQDW